MYQDPYDSRSDYRFRPRLDRPDFWPGLEGERTEPAIFDEHAKRLLVILVLVTVGLGVAAALVVG